jgi:hypothetical protein
MENPRTPSFLMQEKHKCVIYASFVKDKLFDKTVLDALRLQ